MSEDIRGKIVMESEVATNLGFSSVHDMRRWETEMGQKVAKLEEELREAKNDRDAFLRHGRRMQSVLEKIEKLMDENLITFEKYLRAVRVVLGKGVDWKNEFEDWWPKTNN